MCALTSGVLDVSKGVQNKKLHVLVDEFARVQGPPHIGASLPCAAWWTRFAPAHWYPLVVPRVCVSRRLLGCSMSTVTVAVGMSTYKLALGMYYYECEGTSAVFSRISLTGVNLRFSVHPLG